MTYMKKTTAQSMSVSEEEKMTIEVLAVFERMKPAAFVREIFYKGLYQYLQDKSAHAPSRDDAIYDDVVKLIEGNTDLQQIKQVVEARRGLDSRLNAAVRSEATQTHFPPDASPSPPPGKVEAVVVKEAPPRNVNNSRKKAK